MENTAAVQKAVAKASDAATSDRERIKLMGHQAEVVRIAAVTHAGTDKVREIALGVPATKLPRVKQGGTSVPAGYDYSRQGVWLKGGEDVTVGVTPERRQLFGETVYIEVPDAGTEVAHGEPVARLETVISLDEVELPTAVTITAVNDAVLEAPERFDEDPAGAGWLCKVSIPVTGCIELTKMVRESVTAPGDPSVAVRAAAARTAKAESLRWYALTDPAEEVQNAALEGAKDTRFLRAVLENSPSEQVTAAASARLSELTGGTREGVA